MTRIRPLLLALAAALACNLPGLGQVEQATPEAPAQTEAPAPPPTPTQLTPEATSTAAPAPGPFDLTGPVQPASGPGEWPLHNSGNTVTALMAQGETLWAGTSGGIVRWDTATGQYERFTAANGQPLSSVYDFAADPAGQIWAAGLEGLAAYDGASWQPISQADMGLPDAPLRAVAVDAQGNLWAGGDEYFDYSDDPFYIPTAEETQGGLAWRHDGQWEVLDVVEDGLLSNQINDIVAGPDGSVWVALGQAGTEPTPGGVLRILPDGSWQTYTSEGGLDGYAFSDLAFEADGVLWIAGRRGVNRLTQDNVQSYDLPSVNSIAAAPDGTVWIGTYMGLHQFGQGALTPVNIGEISVDALAVTAPGDVWLGAELSLARLAGEALERHYTTDGPLNSFATQLAFAPDGSLWVDTKAGISRLAGGRWEHFFDRRTAVEAAYPWGPERAGLWPADYEGGMWLVEGTAVARYDGSAWADATPAQGAVFLLAPDPAGGMWGTTEEALLRYLGGSWQVVTALDPSVSRFGTADLLVDGQGIVWVSSAISYVDGGSIARWDGSAWTAYTEEQGLAGNATSDLALGPDGQVWAAHPVRGLSRFDGQNWQIEAGDPEALGLGADGFYSITFAPDGSQWFTLMSHCGFEGTCFAGLAHRAGDQWTAIHAAPGSLPTEAVIDLALNDAGQVWLGTFLGVVEVGE